MNQENDKFALHQEKKMQIELAEAASEFKNIPEAALRNTTPQQVIPTGLTW